MILNEICTRLRQNEIIMYNKLNEIINVIKMFKKNKIKY